MKKKYKKKTNKTKYIITKKMLISDVMIKHPETAEAMFNYGLHCIGCGIAGLETIEQGCLTHGLTKQQIEKMLKEMNKKAVRK